MSWKIDGAQVITPTGKAVALQHPVRDSRVAGGVLVAVLEVPPGSVMTENVFGISEGGCLLWQVQPCPANSGDPAFRYTGILRLENTTVWIDNLSQVASAVDIRVGVVFDHENRPKNWKVEGRDVTAQNGKLVSFEYAVSDAAEVDGVLVVVLAVPPKVSMTENVFGVSREGELLWQIKPCAANSTNPVNQYVGITGKVGAIARIYNWNGMNSAVDVHTGKVSDHRFVK